MTDRIDYEHELNNGWDKWQNLVLTGMRENRDATQHLTELTQTLVTQSAVHEEKLTNLTGQVATVATLADGTVARVVVLETQDTKRVAVIKGAWLAIGVSASVIAGVAGLAIGILQIVLS